MASSSRRPANVGIVAMEVYFPRTYVSQELLEAADGCPGKYTRGLGQVNLAFTDDREDITSMMMTVVQSLLDKYQLDGAAIGRLEVGTETLTDKSKSVKTSLMDLLGGNTDVEGITSINACYGGSAALFNSVAWVESSSWDGRYALVVCGDIAVYEPGPARATSGCGVVALLVGPDAPLVLEPVRATHAMDVYDFYKPKHSEYPVVDGRLSQKAYLQSVDQCFLALQRKQRQLQPCSSREEPANLESFDYFCFHSPYHKLPQKGLTRLMYLDFLQDAAKPEYQDVQHLREEDLDLTYDDREIDMMFRKKAEQYYVKKLLPTAMLNKEIGNCYSASIFVSLVSLVNEMGADLVDKRIFMFSYGSGSMASIYTIRGREPDHGDMTVAKMQRHMDLNEKLSRRMPCTVAQFVEALALREEAYGAKDFQPEGDVSKLSDGAYYLTRVDHLYRRDYARKMEPAAGLF